MLLSFPRMLLLSLSVVLSVEANGARALDLDLPGASVETASRDDSLSAQPFPTSAYQGDATQMVMAEGAVIHHAYRLPGTSLTAFQLIDPLRKQLEVAGFRIVFACADSLCGGFDFRYLLDLLPEPAMHVDLGNFQYLLAQHPDGRTIAIVTSRATSAGFVHISTVTPSDTPDVELIAPSPGPETPAGTLPPNRDVIATLEARGRVVLDDLSFETGATELGAGPFASLTQIAAYLTAHPLTKIVLVGHTDTVGGLANNTSLSRKRAEAVRSRMISAHGVSPDQVSAEGIGYLAPRVSNATPKGRETNRRVEAVIASTQ